MKEKYKLIHCYVAQLDDLAEDNIVDIPIRSEAVAFLAARYCLPNIRGLDSIGMSGGQPVARFFDLLPPYCQDVSGITWLSLLATQRHLCVAPMGGSANGIISRLLYNQPHTKGFALPFINFSRRDLEHYRTSTGTEKDELDFAKTTLRKAAYVQAVFLCVGTPGVDYRTTATEILNPELVELFTQLSDHDRELCQGDLLLYLLDGIGNRIGSENQKQMNDALVYSIGLNDLQNMVKSKKQVWVLSESRQKAKMIKAILRAGMVNCLVIENGIADELLDSSI
ncbi:MAG: hypothetical protein ABFD50_09820 [Smithella sp.]